MVQNLALEEQLESDYVWARQGRVTETGFALAAAKTYPFEEGLQQRVEEIMEIAYSNGATRELTEARACAGRGEVHLTIGCLKLAQEYAAKSGITFDQKMLMAIGESAYHSLIGSWLSGAQTNLNNRNMWSVGLHLQAAERAFHRLEKYLAQPIAV